MAGRGTDIQLGGNLDMRVEEARTALEQKLNRELTDAEVQRLTEEIKADIGNKKAQALDAGGLYVLGTERHESRRIDNQLRGRTGRQGDPGKSKFYISLEDDLLRIFAADRLDAIMRRLGIEEDEAIVHPWMNKAMETSQKKVEQRNFEIRKNLLKYDDVINDQRKAIFGQRIEFMRAPDVSETIAEMRAEVIEEQVLAAMPEKTYADQWNIDGLIESFREVFGIEPPIREWASEEGVANQEIIDRLITAANETYEAKAAEAGGDRMRWIEKQILLQELDVRWREHLSQLDQLRSVIHLRGYGQRDPLNEFKSEAFNLFETMLSDLRHKVTGTLMALRFVQPDVKPAEPPTETIETHVDPATGRNEMAESTEPTPAGVSPEDPSTWSKVPRNAPCPCGSGKKFKHCHGSVQAASA